MELNAMIQDVAQSFQAAGPVLKFVFALVGGILSSFTPCIFPLLPIVAITIAASNTSGKRIQAFTLSLSYGAGLAIVYAVLGLVAGLLGASLGRIASHPIAFIVVAVFFAYFALMMFDVYEIPVPQSIMNASANAQQRRGYIAVALTGAFSGIIAAPCLGPVVLFILTYIARDGDPISGFFMMLLYAIGVATLPMLVGTFAGFATTLQSKQGAWMTRVKHLFAWLFIFFALFYAFKAGRNYTPSTGEVVAGNSGNGTIQTDGGTIGNNGDGNAGNGLVTAGGALWDVVSVEKGEVPSKAGDTAIDITFTKNGEQRKLSDFDKPGQVTLLTFWSTNCPECIAEMPHLVEVYNKYKDRGFNVISVNSVTNETRDTVEAFIKKNAEKLPYTVLFDANHAIWDAYELFGTPTNIMIDENGVILDYSISLSQNMEKILEEKLPK